GLLARQALEVLVPLALVPGGDEFLRGDDRDEWLGVGPSGGLCERVHLAVLDEWGRGPGDAGARRAGEKNGEKSCGPMRHDLPPARASEGGGSCTYNPRHRVRCAPRPEVARL